MKREKGITLIALVITIIVMLILVAITVYTAFGENGLIARAREVRDRWAEEQEREQRLLADMDLESDKATGEIPKYMAWSNNVYQQYSSGNVYGIGEKGGSLNTATYEQKHYTWQEFVSPVPNTKAVIPGYGTIYVIDDSNDLWAWGSNRVNKLGLVDDKKDASIVLEPTKITNKKVSQVFPSLYTTFIIEKDTNKIYVAGGNTNGEGGIGNQSVIDTWTEVQFENDVTGKTVKNIVSTNNNHTFIWFTDNTFYFAGNNNWGQIGDGTHLNPHSTIFVQIWNSGAYDIDQDIKDVIFGVATMVLLQDGTAMQAGFTGMTASDGGGAADLVPGSQYNFRKFNTFADGSVESIYAVATGRVVKLKNGEIWATPGIDNVVGTGEAKSESEKFYRVSGVPSNIKEIFSIYSNVYYILENGEVYASGNITGLGKGTENRNKALYIEKLNIPLIESGKTLLDGYTIKGGFNVTIPLLKGKNGKLYITGNSMILYGLNSVQKTFTKVASNVQQFGFTKYIDRDGNLWVVGDNSLYLGFRRCTRESHSELYQKQQSRTRR